MGGKETANLTVDESVSAILKTIANVQLSDSGRYIDRNGQDIAY